jgi:hypothetical protein
MAKHKVKEGERIALKHGVYSIRDHGDRVMTPAQRSVKAELLEQLDTREGAIAALKDQAIETFILAGVAQAYVVQQHEAGVPLDDIPLLRALPAFWNSANRALKSYIDVIPGAPAARSAELDRIDKIIEAADDTRTGIEQE